MVRIIQCNKCGKEIEKLEEDSRLHIEACLGHFSKYDGDEIEVDLCSECADAFLDSLKIDPVI